MTPENTVTDRKLTRQIVTRQIVIRVPEPLYQALQRDADDNGRTVSQSVRFHLRRLLEVTDA